MRYLSHWVVTEYEIVTHIKKPLNMAVCVERHTDSHAKLAQQSLAWDAKRPQTPTAPRSHLDKGKGTSLEIGRGE